MLDMDAILLEKLVILILRLRLDHLDGGIWHFIQDSSTISEFPKLGPRLTLAFSCSMFFSEQVFERKVMNGTIVDASTADGLRQL